MDTEYRQKCQDRDLGLFQCVKVREIRPAEGKEEGLTTEITRVVLQKTVCVCAYIYMCMYTQ